MEKSILNFVFICKNGATIIIQAESKMKAIEKFSKEYEILFDDNWQLNQATTVL